MPQAFLSSPRYGLTPELDLKQSDGSNDNVVLPLVVRRRSAQGKAQGSQSPPVFGAGSL